MVYAAKFGALAALPSLSATHEKSGHGRGGGRVFVLAICQFGKESAFAGLLLPIVQSHVLEAFLWRSRLSLHGAVN